MFYQTKSMLMTFSVSMLPAENKYESRAVVLIFFPPHFQSCYSHTTQVEYIRCKTSPWCITSEKYGEGNIGAEISQLALISAPAKHLQTLKGYQNKTPPCGKKPSLNNPSLTLHHYKN